MVSMTRSTISKHLLRTIEELKPKFMGYANQEASMLARRRDMAPLFNKAFEEWQRETKGRGLVAFLQTVDPSMPVERSAYQRHRTFMAAWYLVRVTKATAEGRRFLLKKAGFTLSLSKRMASSCVEKL
jgi:hypothetical protein